ncbi:MAG TPA: rod-binding protein [Verrucomicrobiae bacterium]|nr:rod-binding protein [Verrucomicrobiae bacterium]
MNVAPLPSDLNAAEVPLERLAANGSLSEEQKVGEAARQFEAMLVRQILESTSKSVIPSTFTEDSTASGIYRDMINNQLADSISRSGSVGLAQILAREFSRQNCGKDAPPAALLNESTQAPAAAIQKFLTSPKFASPTPS